ILDCVIQVSICRQTLSYITDTRRTYPTRGPPVSRLTSGNQRITRAKTRIAFGMDVAIAKVMRMRLVWFIWILIFLASGARGQQSSSTSTEELSLTQAVELALKDNRQLQMARLEVEKFDDRLAVAKTHRLPKFEFSVLAAELVNRIHFNFKQGDLGTLPGLG